MRLHVGARLRARRGASTCARRSRCRSTTCRTRSSHASASARAPSTSRTSLPRPALAPRRGDRRARPRAGLTTIVDGAHAPGQVDLDLDALGADFYSGNCHKWMCAPKGAGFLHVGEPWQERVDGAIVSWGYAEPSTFLSRTERQGTRDPAAYLAVADAIAFVREHDVRERCVALAREARAAALRAPRAPSRSPRTRASGSSRASGCRAPSPTSRSGSSTSTASRSRRWARGATISFASRSRCTRSGRTSSGCSTRSAQLL